MACSTGHWDPEGTGGSAIDMLFFPLRYYFFSLPLSVRLSEQRPESRPMAQVVRAAWPIECGRAGSNPRRIQVKVQRLCMPGGVSLECHARMEICVLLSCADQGD